MSLEPMTRRELLRLAGVMAAAQVVGCGTNLPPIIGGNPSNVAFIRSGRNTHVSNAAKKQNANRIYATFEAAMIDAPHPGDSSKVVQISISKDLHAALFGGGGDTVDLRRFFA